MAPLEEVCLGAEQHDVGHTAWEQVPTLNPQTGLPYSFLEMPRHLHVQIWSQAARCVLPQGRYAALLVSLHGTRFYQHYDAANDLPENAQAVQRYLAQERAFQEKLLTSMRTDPHYEPKRLKRSWSVIDGSLGSGMRSRWPFASVESLHSHGSRFLPPRVRRH